MLVVSGPNGSGKTTMAKLYSAEFGYPYIGADDIAFELCPEDPASQQIEAARRFRIAVREAISKNQSVVIESTLSGRTFLKTMERAQEAGFRIILVHIFLDSADTCVERVAERVLKGGHYVPEVDVRRRCPRSAWNFWQLYRFVCDHWILFYNSEFQAQPVAEGGPDSHAIRDQRLLTLFEQIGAQND